MSNVKIPADQVSDAPRYVPDVPIPSTEAVHALLEEAYASFRDLAEGALSSAVPSLQLANPDHFGLAVMGVNGRLHERGDSQVPFTIQSVSKPFTYALVAQAHGIEFIREKIGVNATGLPFNSAQAVEQGVPGPTNPLVNAGAIATASYAVGEGVEERWSWLRNGLSRFAGRDLKMNHDVLESERATNYRNRALGNLMRSFGALTGSPLDAVEIYTRACSLEVTAADLAAMGAVLADGGVHPVTSQRVVSAEVARLTLAVMLVAGMYETSGDWLVDVGMPGKSGIGGGMVTVAPGKGAFATFSPLLDHAGNSVRGGRVATMIGRTLGLDMLASRPYAPGSGGDADVDPGAGVAQEPDAD